MTGTVRNVLDYIFLAGMVFTLFMADRMISIFILFGVLPIFALWSLKDFRTVRVPYRTILLPAAAYFAYCLAALYFFTGLKPGEARPPSPNLEFYLVAIAMLVVGMGRGLQVRDLYGKFQKAIPTALLISFAILTFYAFVWPERDCRVRVEADWPFIPALLFATFTLLSFLGWRDMARTARRLRLLLLALSITVMIGYTSSRGISLAMLIVLVSLGALSFMPGFKGTLPRVRELVAMTLAGLALSGLVTLAQGCGSYDRFGPLVKLTLELSSDELGIPDDTAPQQNAATPAPAPAPAPAKPAPAPSATPTPPAAVTPETANPQGEFVHISSDISIGLRLQMWAISLTAIEHAPILGNGAMSLYKLIQPIFGYPHNHNQFLAWLVMGGVVFLALGLWLLSVPYRVSKSLQAPDRAVVILSVIVLWSVAMSFDAYMTYSFYLHYYCILIGFLYALCNDIAKKQPAEAGQS